MDTDPDFGQYWHFCYPFIDVLTDKTHIKGKPIPILYTDTGIRVGYITKHILFGDILVQQKASKLGFVKEYSKGFKY